ncbi:hypothetical protein VCEM1536_003150B, partial [Vibrio cholerae O1 str. EM-1536]
LLRMDVGIRC